MVKWNTVKTQPTCVFFSQLACSKKRNVKITHYQIHFKNAQMVPIVCQRSPWVSVTLATFQGLHFCTNQLFLNSFLQYIGTDQLFLNSKHLYLFPTYFSSLNIAIIVFIRERERERRKKEERKARKRGGEKQRKKKIKEERSPNYLFVLEVSTMSGQWCHTWS